MTRWCSADQPISIWPKTGHTCRSQRQSFFKVRLGRRGDVVDFKALPSAVQSVSMALLVGAASEYSEDDVQACGSPGEVANDPMLGHKYRMLIAAERRPFWFAWEGLFVPYERSESKHMVWTNVVLTAPDQLRQRVAWALSQFWVLGVDGSGRDQQTEEFLVGPSLRLHYYDITTTLQVHYS